jgi:predicted ATPase/DNA-binding CsgD family transcriptional regulator
VGCDEPGTAVGGWHGFPGGLTNFVGRAAEVDKVAALLDEGRLVTVTGPGGVGKTRLAGEVARRVAGRFADGAWLVELAAVTEPDQVPVVTAAALGVSQVPGLSVTESLVAVLARRQMLLVLDNCEHLLGAAAQLCGSLLAAADDVQVLATSREPVGVGGESRYRLGPLGLPGPGDQEIGGSEAVTLFAARARQADAYFTLDDESGPVVAEIVTRLDGVPLAIELAAARVEALGLDQLLDRLDDRFTVLTAGNRLAPSRHQSLAATVQWSYLLLGEAEQRVFRLVSVFPGPFTLAGAEAVAGPGAGAAVMHLVDCSLLIPPRTGPDGRARYMALETLRAYGAERLAEAGEQREAAAALAGHALAVAESAAAELAASGGELAAARWLDAEDATVHLALNWALGRDPATALRLAVALAPWWYLRGRWAAGRVLLTEAVQPAVPAGLQWCAGQVWLGYLAWVTADYAAALGHFTLACEAAGATSDAVGGGDAAGSGDAVGGGDAAGSGDAVGGGDAVLADGLLGRSAALRNLGRLAEAAQDADRALAISGRLGYLVGRVSALRQLGLLRYYQGDQQASLAFLRQAEQVPPGSIPDRLARECITLLAMALAADGQVAAAQRSAADGLARARRAGDLPGQAQCLEVLSEVDEMAGRLPEARAHLLESLEIATRTGDRPRLIGCLDKCGHICAATGQYEEAITLWAAFEARRQDYEIMELPDMVTYREEPLRKARHALGPARTRAARERGAAMTLQAADEYAAMLAGPGPREPSEPSGLEKLSAREKQLVTLVARGATNAQIAEQLFISVRTVGSHLDRIRDKTSCRRRADLTRLALQAGLI